MTCHPRQAGPVRGRRHAGAMDLAQLAESCGARCADSASTDAVVQTLLQVEAFKQAAEAGVRTLDVDSQGGLTWQSDNGARPCSPAQLPFLTRTVCQLGVEQPLVLRVLTCSATVTQSSWRSHWSRPVLHSAVVKARALGDATTDQLNTFLQCALQQLAPADVAANTGSHGSLQGGSRQGVGEEEEGVINLGQAASCQLLHHVTTATLAAPQPPPQAQQGSLKAGKGKGRQDGGRDRSQQVAIEGLLSAEQLQSVADHVLSALPLWGHALQREAMEALLPSLMTVCAQRLGSPYHGLCVRLAQHLLGTACRGAPAGRGDPTGATAPGEAAAHNSQGAGVPGGLLQGSGQGGAGLGDSKRASETLQWAVAMEMHVMQGCQALPDEVLAIQQQAAANRHQLQSLLLVGLQHPHSHARARAIHLVQAAMSTLSVPGMGKAQWEAFVAIYRAQEERVLHLVHPVWQSCYPVLWAGVDQATGASMAQVLPWVSVLIRRACDHPHVTMRHTGLSHLWSLPVQHPTLCQDPVAWNDYQTLLLSLLSTLESDKVLPGWSPVFTARGSATVAGQGVSRQTTQLSTLRQSLTRCIGSCLAHLPATVEGDQWRQELLYQLLTATTAVAQRAATAAFLLQSVADTLTHATPSHRNSHSHLPPVPAEQLLMYLQPLVGQLSYLRPACHIRHLHAAVLRIAAAWLDPAQVPVSFLLQLLTSFQGSASLSDWPQQISTGCAGSWQHAAVQAVQAAGPAVPLWLLAVLLGAPALAAAGPEQTPLSKWLTQYLNPDSTTHSGDAAEQHAQSMALAALLPHLSSQCRQVVSVVVQSAIQRLPALSCMQASSVACLLCGLWFTGAVSNSSGSGTPQEAQLLQVPQEARPQQVAQLLQVPQEAQPQQVAQLLQRWGSAAAAPAGEEEGWLHLQLWTVAVVCLTLDTKPKNLDMTDAVLGAGGLAPFMERSWANELASDNVALLHQVRALTGLRVHLQCPAPQVPATQLALRLCELQPAAASAGDGGGQVLPAAVARLAGDQLQLVRLECLLLVVRQLGASPPSSSPPPEVLQIQGQVFQWCLEQLSWVDPASETLSLQTLLAVAQLTAPIQQPAAGTPVSAADEEKLQQLLRLLPGLIRTSGGDTLPASVVPHTVSLFFHPSLFRIESLRRTLDERLIPLALSKGGPRLAVATVDHLMSKVLLLDTSLLLSYLPHIAHLLAFSLFSAAPPTSLATLAALRLDPALTLLPRVVLCDHLVKLARGRTQDGFIEQLVMRLLLIATGSAQDSSNHTATDSGYSWLAGRESSTASVINSVKVACWQAVSVLAPQLQGEAAQKVLSTAWQCLLTAHQQGNIRPHVQLVVLALLSGSAGEAGGVERLLLPALRTYAEAKYQVVVSVVVVALFYALQAGPRSPHFWSIVQVLFPWSLHHRHAIRVPVQVLLHAVLTRHGLEAWADSTQLDAGSQTLLKQVEVFLTQNSEMRVLRERQGIVQLDSFDLVYETSIEGVFGVRRAASGSEASPADSATTRAVAGAAGDDGGIAVAASGGEDSQDSHGVVEDGESDLSGLNWHIHVRDRLPLDILSLLPGAVKAVGQAARSTAAGDSVAPGDLTDTVQIQTAAGSQTQTAAGDPSDSQRPGFQQQLRPQLASQQVAAAAADQPLLLDDAAEQLVGAVAAGRQQGSGRQGLVVVASLLDNVPNMAGLCRTCESMGCEALVLPNKATAQSEAFKRQSVTSERWLTLVEVTPSDLANYLNEQKALGYTVVGVEQASHSVGLQSYQWPQKALLVLGNEQNGIPAPLLPLLDVCVEIPMLGYTRSMNAHVSGAMAVWEYTKQKRHRQTTS